MEYKFYIQSFMIWIMISVIVSIAINFFGKKRNHIEVLFMVQFLPLWFAFYLTVAFISMIYRVCKNSIDLIINID